MLGFLEGLKKVGEAEFAEDINCYVLNENKKLTHLHICSKKNIDFAEISNLAHLLCLELPANNVNKIPQSISNLQNLEKLRLDINNISEIPQSMQNLKQLSSFDISDNPITKNIREIESRLNPQELISYLLEVQNKATKPLNEAKILVVGDERVGKTSIINRLLGKKHNPAQQSTFGIDIQKNNFGGDIQFNIWDFAGQEITHQTHQFFLSARSLYLYVIDSQKEDNDSGIFHWLNVIKAHAENSPIIVVVNKRDLNVGYHFDINRFEKDFNIVDVLYVSAETDEQIKTDIKKHITHSIDDLINSITTHAQTLEDINFPLPPSWLKVKQTLEAFPEQQVDYIQSDQYESICEQHGITNTHLQNTLLAILNQIGTVVTYRNNKRLRAMQIINPLWVTNGVYKIIRSTAIDSAAILSESQYQQIFCGDPKYKEHHFIWLIDLLNQYELSFPVSDSAILIPAKLSPNQPEFDLTPYQQGLNFRYSYQNILKKSVISQFIVKIRAYLSPTASPRYWQRGVFLAHHDANAVVIADEDNKTLTIAIDANTRAAKELLSIIRHTIRDINGDAPRIFEEVPLILAEQIVGHVGYDLLIDAEKEGDEAIRQQVEAQDKVSHRFTIATHLDGYRYQSGEGFDYKQLGKDLIAIALIETESRHPIFKESEDLTNDRFRNALLHKGYHVSDQSRGGESESRKSVGERDIVVRNNNTGVAESVIEGFILSRMDTSNIDKHYTKLTTSYDTVGNERNIILVYAKAKNFDDLWQSYQNHFDGFDETSEGFVTKDNIRYGITQFGNMKVLHIMVNFYSAQPKQSNNDKY